MIAIKSNITPALCIEDDQEIFYSEYQLQLYSDPPRALYKLSIPRDYQDQLDQKLDTEPKNWDFSKWVPMYELFPQFLTMSF